ncbi:MAG TPA: glutaredoxin 3 [Xanthomonadaceae bacterium]|nr:glutaredoxin 3 [Xanthomonadaceae bacterium]
MPRPDVVLFSSAVCPYCMAAKNFLKQRGVEWRELRVDLDPAARAEMLAKAKRTSVPQIFINGTHVGGFDDMVALDRAGGLAPLLESAP